MEHGLQIIYRAGRVLSRVREQDGHLTFTDAHDMPEEQGKIDGQQSSRASHIVQTLGATLFA